MNPSPRRVITQPMQVVSLFCRTLTMGPPHSGGILPVDCSIAILHQAKILQLMADTRLTGSDNAPHNRHNTHHSVEIERVTVPPSWFFSICPSQNLLRVLREAYAIHSALPVPCSDRLSEWLSVAGMDRFCC